MNVIHLPTHRPPCSRPATDAATLRRDDHLIALPTESRKLEKAIRSNLEGLGYGG
jgi:hypothetical protein